MMSLPIETPQKGLVADSGGCWWLSPQANSDLPKTVTCLIISYAELWNNSSCNPMSVDEDQSVSWLQTYVFLVNTVHDNNRYC